MDFMSSNAARWIHRVSLLLTVAWCATAPAAPAAPIQAPSNGAAHFSAAGLNDEDDLLRIYSGDFQSVHLDRGGTVFMVISSSYMEDFARDCTRFLPANKVEITVQACPKTDIPYVPPSDRPTVPPPPCVPQTFHTGLYADPQLYAAVQNVSARSSVNLLANMLGMGTAKGSHGPSLLNMSAQLNDQLVAVGTEMESVIRTNVCGSPGLKNFQVNLIRFANGEAPIKFAGAVTSGPPGSGGPIRDADFTRLLDDLLVANARAWMVNRYQAGSISDPIVAHDPQGRPVRIMARYGYVDSQGRQRGRVTLTFKDGSPECLYFSDAPDTCREPATRVVSAYERNGYAKYSLPTGPSPFRDGCNAFMRDPKTSRYAPSDPTGYCTCLSEKYKGVMTPAEEVLYGSNFKEKFWYGVAQAHSTDPAWARLNPGAVSCMQ